MRSERSVVARFFCAFSETSNAEHEERVCGAGRIVCCKRETIAWQEHRERLIVNAKSRKLADIDSYVTCLVAAGLSGSAQVVESDSYWPSEMSDHLLPSYNLKWVLESVVSYYQ